MTLKVNGKVFTAAEAALTVAEVLQRSSVANPEMVAVQLNGEFVAKEKILEKVQGNYLQFAKEEPSRFVCVDAQKDQKEITKFVAGAIRLTLQSSRSRRRQ